MLNTLDSALAAAPAWLPLVPRNRPTCQPPADRITNLAIHADSAADTHIDPTVRITAATRVLNLAALLLSDTGHPRHARQLCQTQYNVFQHHTPLNDTHATWALQPLINIARLHTRVGHGTTAHRILTALHQAIITDTPVRIDGHSYDLKNLAPDALPALARFTWSTLLADGTHALTQAGRWTEALAVAREHRGVGARLLDGRQIAVLAHISNSEYDNARDLIATTRHNEPWDQAVAAILDGLTNLAADRSPRLSSDEVGQHIDGLDQADELRVFRARVTLMLLGLMDPEDPSSRTTGAARVAGLVGDCDGYVARDILAARWIAPYLSSAIRDRAIVTFHAAGLTSPLPHNDVDHIRAIARAAVESLDTALFQASRSAVQTTTL